MGIYVCPLVVASVLIRSWHLLACKVIAFAVSVKLYAGVMCHQSMTQQ